jgi:TP53 regulating kinase-like protein
MQVLVDFGLAYTSNLVEDKAVDLYVLERALGATHPDGGVRFDCILAAYAVALGDKEWKKTETRFKDGKAITPSNRVYKVLIQCDSVRLRGRKRSMVG